jgi:hypothetical protein
VRISKGLGDAYGIDSPGKVVDNSASCAGAEGDMLSDYFRKNWPVLGGCLIALLYFGYFLLPTLNGGFGNDDAYNIYYYWSRGVGSLLRGMLLFFTSYYRPMGGAYFYSLYEAFGLNPFPYHAVIVLLVLLNSIFVYRCASILSGSKIIGGFCSILMVYHPRMPLLVYVPAFTFDILCATFYFGALFYYLRIRSQDRNLKSRQWVLFLLLYIAALESKELAVSLPVMILAYELLWHMPERTIKGISRWLRTSGWPVLASGLITVCYVIGKSIGPDALSHNPMYQVTLSLERFLDSNVRLARDLFYLKPRSWLNAPWLVFLWALFAYVAISRRKNHLKFSLIMLLVAPLPIAFLPYRGAILYPILLFGWALISATVVDSICSFVARELLCWRVPPYLAKVLPLLLAVGLLWHQTVFQHRKVKVPIQNAGREFRLVKAQLQTLLPKPGPGARIAFYNDLFDGWDCRFIAELLYKDRSITVHLNQKAPLDEADLGKMDYVLAFQKEKLVIVKRPGEPFKRLQ